MVKAPVMFKVRTAGRTVVTRTTGVKIASDSLKGRVFEANLGDLSGSEDDAHRKIKLRCEEVEGDNVLTTFHGMDLTRDKLCSLIKKWQSLVEARVDIKTTDGYSLRIFAIGFTKKRPNQVKKTCYANSAQVCAIRKRMVDIMMDESKGTDMKKLVNKFITESIAKKIEKSCEGIYPLQNCYIRKVKVTGTPKFDLARLMELHTETAEEIGAKLERSAAVAAAEVAPNLPGAGGRL
jgi:small subunit ribosomal protein S3Ae